MRPYFSIVIPTLNEERFVGNLLEDLTLQTYRSFEVLHIDGNSDDKTLSIVNSFTDRLPILSKMAGRRNLSYQRNLGGELAQGEYLIFVDADTRLKDSSFLECIYRHAQKTRCHIYLPRSQFMGTAWMDVAAQYINNTMVRLSQMTPRPLPTSGLAIFRRDFFATLAGYTVSEKHDKKVLFVEDQDIMMRAYRRHASREYIQDAVYGFSLRRYHKDGWLHVMIGVVLLTIQLTFSAKTSDHTYEMGGQSYKTPML